MILVFIAFCGCNKDDGSGCLTNVGDIVSEERHFESPFNTLDIRDNATVTIKEGPEYKVIVKGGANLINSYTTTIDGYKLVIENQTSCQWMRDQDTPYDVYITMPEIDSILYSGYGNIYSDGVLEVDTFKIITSDGVGDIELAFSGSYLYLIQQTGATNVKLTGSFDYVYCYSTSYSIIDLEELVCPRGFYTNGGTGDFRISTTDYIKVQLNLTGNIYYTNDPEIFIEMHSGSGQLIHF